MDSDVVRTIFSWKCYLALRCRRRYPLFLSALCPPYSSYALCPPLSTRCLEPLNTTANPHAPHLAHPRTRGSSLSRPSRGTLHHLLRRVGAAAVAGRVRCPTMNKSHAAPVCVCTSTSPLHVYLFHGLRCYFTRECAVWLVVQYVSYQQHTHDCLFLQLAPTPLTALSSHHPHGFRVYRAGTPTCTWERRP